MKSDNQTIVALIVALRYYIKAMSGQIWTRTDPSLPKTEQGKDIRIPPNNADGVDILYTVKHKSGLS